VTGRAACASQFEAWQGRMQRALAARLPSAAAEPTRLHAAMRYCVLQGGERLRPLLLFGTARALGLDEAQVEGAACALELVHAYSLVHEDLPALQHSAGAAARPACHEAYDEGTAVLVGDALQSLAFQLLASDAALPAAPQVRLQLIALLAHAIGLSGLSGGQSLDASTQGRSLSVAELEALYSRRSGALLRASVLMAAACAPQSSAALRESLGAFATRLALALRLRQELSGTAADGAAPWARYATALGTAASRDRLGQLQTEALASLGPLGPAAAPLTELAQWLLEMPGPQRLP
jgi:geranylgeranyl pyrophosphate synthase